MSRTYRTYETWKLHAHGKFYTDAEDAKLSYEETRGWQYARFWDKQRDSKPYFKPKKSFKKIRRRIERAKVKQAMRERKDIPIFKKGDVWDWN